MKQGSIKSQLRKTAALGSVISLLLTVVVMMITASVIMGLYSSAMEEKLGEMLALQGVNIAELIEAVRTTMINTRHADMGTGSLLVTLFILLILVAVVGFTSWLVSNDMARKITRPLDELKLAANHVAQGDLDYQISYQEQNEFGTVCEAFTEMQAHLKASIEKDLALEQSRKELFAGISHDLRTPLTAIRGYVKGIQDGVASTPQKQEKYLDIILAKTHDMEKLVERLFLYSKLDAGSESFSFMAVSADAYLAGFLEVIRSDMAQKGLSIVYEPGAAPDLRLKLDYDQMYRVFTNLLDNSAKYVRDRQGVVTIATRSDAQTFIISFADNGPGVPEEALDRLFETFYRADPARTQTHKGSGLGLAIAEKIVTAHGGSIRAGNNQGLVITIELPIML